MKKKVFCFDLDNVICVTKNNNYKKSLPLIKNIKIINQLYHKGHIIKIFTARYMGRSNDNKITAKKLASNLTKKQLKEWGVNYNKLIFGKPSYDIFVDDKNLCYKKNWRLTLQKKFL